MTEQEKEYARQWRKRNPDKVKQYRRNMAIRAYLKEVKRQKCRTNDSMKDLSDSGQEGTQGNSEKRM